LVAGSEPSVGELPIRDRIHRKAKAGGGADVWNSADERERLEAERRIEL
jgi:hypothetical protein